MATGENGEHTEDVRPHVVEVFKRDSVLATAPHLNLEERNVLDLQKASKCATPTDAQFMVTGDHGKDTEPALNHATVVFNTVSVNVTILLRNTEAVHAKDSTDINVVVLMTVVQCTVLGAHGECSLHARRPVEEEANQGADCVTRHHPPTVEANAPEKQMMSKNVTVKHVLWTATGVNGDHSVNAAHRAVVVSPSERELATALHLSMVVPNVQDPPKTDKNATLENVQ